MQVKPKLSRSSKSALNDEDGLIQQLKSEEEDNEEEENLQSDYEILAEPVSLMSVTAISLKDSTEVTNHIVLCGIHPSIYYFMLPLRAKYLKEWQYIVILSEEKPSEVWDYINRFPKIIYIKGSPLIAEDLMRANINFADKAVIFAQESGNERGGGSADEMQDAKSIFIYKGIQKINPDVQIMIELIHSSNIEFLLPKERDNVSEESKMDRTPLYAAGQIYSSNIIDTLTCQTYYNQHLLTILQQFLMGGRQSKAVIREICAEASL